jgi:arsenate reductase (glutaredoxin)
MKKIYYLSTCDTCKKIMKELPLDDFIKVDIKTNSLTENDLEELYALSGSYEVLFSKVARLYRSMNLKEKNLQEVDFKKYLLEHYTFLKRPVFIIDKEVFIGNAKKNIELVKSKLA